MKKEDVGKHYRKYWKGVQIDPARICIAYDINHPMQRTMVKKILAAGQRGKKNLIEDIKDMENALERWKEMELEGIKSDIKIASYCSFVSDSEIGGGQTAAFQFKEWCDIIGYECDAVTAKKNSGERVKKLGIVEYDSIEEIEDKYDFILFTTPSWDADFEVDYANLKVPYAVMIRGETDDILFGGVDKVREICHHSAINIFNSSEYFGVNADFVYCVMSRKYCMDDYQEIKIYNDDAARSGVCYSGRITKLKGAEILARMSNNDVFVNSVGHIDVYGFYNKKNTRSSDFKSEIDEISPNWNMIDEVISTYDSENMSDILSKYNFYWDYSVVIDKKRFNIVCLEAMFHGCLPIVNKDSIPPSFKHKEYCLSPDEVGELSDRDIMRLRKIMATDLKNGYYGFDSMLKMNEKLISKICEAVK